MIVNNSRIISIVICYLINLLLFLSITSHFFPREESVRIRSGV